MKQCICMLGNTSLDFFFSKWKKGCITKVQFGQRWWLTTDGDWTQRASMAIFTIVLIDLIRVKFYFELILKSKWLHTNLNVSSILGTLQKHKWENAMTIDKQSWGYRPNARLEDFLTVAEIVQGLYADWIENFKLLPLLLNFIVHNNDIRHM